MVYVEGLSRVMVRISVRESVKVSVSFSIINVYAEHRYLSALHCISQHNGIER